MLDAGQDVLVQHPGRRGKGLFGEKRHGRPLLIGWDHLVDGALLVHRLCGTHDAADDRYHVPHVPVPLAQHLVVQLLELAVVLALLVGPLPEVGDDAFQVRDPVLAGPHRIVAQRLSGGGRVVLAASAVPVHRIVGLFLDPFVERSLFGVGAVCPGDGPVSPPNGVQVIGADAGHEAHAFVFGLRHVVEPGVVHNGRSRPHAAGERRRPQRIDGVRRAGLHRVLQADGVTHLVGGDEPDELAHHVVVELHPSCLRVGRRRLHEVPVPHQVHHVVIPVDVALQDFPGAWIVHVWAGRVLYCRREVADHRVADVFRAELGVFLRRGGIPGDDGIAESRLLEGHLPVLDALLEVGAPFFRGGGVDVIHDLLHGIHQFAAGPRLGIARLETPPDDVPALSGALLVPPVVVLCDTEEPHAVVPQAWLHGLIGQEDHRVVHLERDRPGGSIRRSLGGLVREDAAHFDVSGKALCAGRERPARVETADSVLGAPPTLESQHRHVGCV